MILVFKILKAKDMVQKANLIVVSQSLVVDTYRSFFYELDKISSLNAETDLATGLFVPERFVELAGQLKTCAPFSPPFSRQSTAAHARDLPAVTVHVQAVLFRGLLKAIKGFVKSRPKGSNNIVFAMAEPYSVTCLMIWIQAQLALKGDFKFYCLATQNIKKDFNFWVRCLQKFVLRRCDGIFALGSEHQKVIRAQGYRGPCFDFPLWFDRSVFYRHALEPSLQALRIKRRKGLEGKVTIGFSGLLSEAKGILDLLDFFEFHLGGYSSSYCLLICGDGPLKNQVKMRVDRLFAMGLNIRFLGAISSRKMPFFLSLCDIVVVPSRSQRHWKEQFGRIIVEAMACSCLVIGSDSGEIPTVIGSKEFVFAEGDLDALAKTLEHAVASLARNEALVMQRRALENYSDKSLALRFFNTLVKLI